jgi:hypothetical protein
VIKSVGTRTRSATPVQKRENRRAVIKERASVPRAKARNRATGVEDRMNWIRTNVCNDLASSQQEILKIQIEGE